ncbi:acyloxyacyl hydrolase [Salinibacter grassmerensis]|uniref:acyloxyacyl hydrolase n=1 Tax=Salinibacter grassmerensis TaxID=3040353 RepID=UPI0021E6FE8C|nr:acyloxyacyl hydrolase [Salinibacter grassmerensis]
MHARLAVVALLVSLGVVVPCVGQTTDSLAPAPSTNAIGVWAGGSFATGRLIGNIRRARMGLIGLRYHRLLAPSSRTPLSDGPTLTYTADLLPVLFLSIPAGALSPLPSDRPAPERTSSPSRPQGRTAVGVGVRPAGLRLTFRPDEHLQPFLAGSTGLAFFNRSVPNALGRSLNFMFDVGAGVRVVVTSALILTAGYRYHHLSNGFRGQINPGVDANLFQLGVTVSP